MWWLWEQFRLIAPTAQLGGIFANKSGYHNTRDANLASDYSRQLAVDKLGPGDKAAAIDLTLSTTLMKTHTARLNAAAVHPLDDRTNYIREFIGTLDGTSVFCRIASGPGTTFVYDAGRDSSHLWHIHLSIYRKFVADLLAMKAILSIFKGETFEQWKASLLPRIEESPMLIVKEVDRPEVYLTDGFKYRHLTPEALLRTQAVLTSRGLNSAITNVPAGHVRAGYLGDPEVKPPTADEIADAVVAKLPASGGSYTLTDIKEAVKAALREGTAV
jgi:hypothetical protein